jgi:hypothetical protein
VIRMFKNGSFFDPVQAVNSSAHFYLISIYLYPLDHIQPISFESSCH